MALQLQPKSTLKCPNCESFAVTLNGIAAKIPIECDVRTGEPTKFSEQPYKTGHCDDCLYMFQVEMEYR